MRWDGLFHAATGVIIVIGVYMLRSKRRQAADDSVIGFTGQMIFGWGAFNIVEGVLNHHLLEVHHVRDLPFHVPLYDWAFLLVAGFGFVAAGWTMMRPTLSAE